MDAARVLVADDERPARRRLRSLVAGVPWIGEVLEAGDGETAVRLIDSERPDIVFLDVRMPGASGLEVVERVRHRPHVVFTTAYDRHAVTAFELQAIDYLLKPFGAERFAAALERVRHAMAAGPAGPPRLPDAATAPLRRLFVRRGGRVLPIAVERIQRCEAAGDYVRIHTSDDRHLVAVRLSDLAERLPDSFLQVHRSHVVNLAHVEEFRPHPGSRFLVRLVGGAEVVASRARSREIRRRTI